MTRLIDLSLLFLMTFGLALIGNAQNDLVVQFSLNMNGVTSETGKITAVGIRGSLPPLSWEKTLVMQDEDGDGVFTTKVFFPAKGAKPVLEYKYVYGEVVWEFANGGNRSLALDGTEIAVPTETWNTLRPPSPEEMAALRYTPEQLQEDFAIFKKAYSSLHPGLYRYVDSLTMEAYFDDLQLELRKEMDLPALYLAFSQFLAKIQCGHTFCNPWNQNTVIRQAIFDRPDKVPFHFRLINRRMIVTDNASGQSLLNRDMEILAIDGRPVSQILDSLFTISHADGSNDGRRMNQLQLTGIDKFELFDIYFPLFFPPVSGAYTLTGKNLQTGEAFSASVPAMSRQERLDLLAKQSFSAPKKPDDLWNFRMLDAQTAYLQLGTFSIYQMEMDWKKFLKDHFEQLTEKAVPNLIIDIRGNGGGMDEVIAAVASYLIDQPMTIAWTDSRFRSPGLPAEIKPYVSTWDDWFEKEGPKMVPAGNGMYKVKNAKPEQYTLKPRKKNYQGKVYLLIDAANSSATHYMANQFKTFGLATLVGQETGGNLRGMNGGLMYFLRLPNSGIEMDIPIIGNYPATPQPDQGVLPDVAVEPSVEDVVNGVDTELEVVLKMIGKEEKR